MQRDWHDEAAAIWLAPLAGTIPLIAACSFPGSPFFLGRLMEDATHPMNWPYLGPLISALAVVFDAGLLGMLAALALVVPAYVALREHGRASTGNILMVCCGTGLVASQFARMIAQGFRQADLRSFANSGASAALGCLCGLAAGVCIGYFRDRRRARAMVWCAPFAAIFLSAVVLVWSARVWQGR